MTNLLKLSARLALLLACATVAVHAGEPGADDGAERDARYAFLRGTWVSGVSQGQGDLKTYCSFRRNHSYRCETMNLHDGTADSAYGVYEITQAQDGDFVLMLQMDPRSPLTPGVTLSEIYRVIDDNTIKHVLTETVVKRFR